jgi:hypothetical protein
MPAKYNLLPLTTFNNVITLDSVLCLLCTHGKITRTQYVGLHKLAATSYPCALEIDQRMAKQMLYISINGNKYQLNNRAKLQLVRENT